MHSQRKATVGLLSAGMLLVTMVGCGPIVFSDASGLAIVGTAPEPEAAPEPPPPEKRVVVEDNRIKINEKVQFEYDSAKILPVSHDLLNEVAKVIKENTHIKAIEVGGHASAEGSDNYNLRLSDKRAKAVMKYLSGKGGIEKAMLSAKGYGESQPIASNDNEEGRETNRRVEFKITEQDVTQRKFEVDDSGKKTEIKEGKG